MKPLYKIVSDVAEDKGKIKRTDYQDMIDVYLDLTPPKIEYGIDPPIKTVFSWHNPTSIASVGSLTVRYPFFAMCVGSSFCVPKEIAGHARLAASDFKKEWRHLEWDYTARKQSDGSLRVWRIA